MIKEKVLSEGGPICLFGVGWGGVEWEEQLELVFPRAWAGLNF